MINISDENFAKYFHNFDTIIKIIIFKNQQKITENILIAF